MPQHNFCFFFEKENRCGECCAYLCDKTAAPEGRTSVSYTHLAIIGAVAAVAAIAYGVYRFFTPDYLEDFEDDFDDDFDDDFFEEEEENADK